jgi:hypothetical protein
MNRIVYFAGTVLIGGFFVIIGWRLFTGGIPLDYLLYGGRRDRISGDYSEFFSPGRVQLLIVSVVMAGYYLAQVIHDPTRFPEIPTSWLVALGGSHGIYLGGKAQSLFFGIRDPTDRR